METRSQLCLIFFHDYIRPVWQVFLHACNTHYTYMKKDAVLIVQTVLNMFYLYDQYITTRGQPFLPPVALLFPTLTLF